MTYLTSTIPRKPWTARGKVAATVAALVLVQVLALGLVAMSRAAAGSRVHTRRVSVLGAVKCQEDARLVPIRFRGYTSRPGGWLYTCWNFDGNGPTAANRVHVARVRVVGRARCAEDARLTPIRSRGYVGSRPGGWVYRCRNFDDGGPFYRG